MPARTKAPESTCKHVIKWLGLNLGRKSLAALTGTDWRSLEAAAHILECWAYSGDDRLLDAFRIVVLQMQPSTREFAYHAVACLNEWETRAKVWVLAGLPPLDRVSRCLGDRDAWTRDEWNAMQEREVC